MCLSLGIKAQVTLFLPRHQTAATLWLWFLACTNNNFCCITALHHAALSSEAPVHTSLTSWAKSVFSGLQGWGYFKNLPDQPISPRNTNANHLPPASLKHAFHTHPVPLLLGTQLAGLRRHGAARGWGDADLLWKGGSQQGENRGKGGSDNCCVLRWDPWDVVSSFHRCPLLSEVTPRSHVDISIITDLGRQAP